MNDDEVGETAKAVVRRNTMRVVDGKITEHWGMANLFSLMQQLGTHGGTV
jgi:predicted SnoaL-like aldol condensation-catalyzing enzyme